MGWFWWSLCELSRWNEHVVRSAIRIRRASGILESIHTVHHAPARSGCPASIPILVRSPSMNVLERMRACCKKPSPIGGGFFLYTTLIPPKGVTTAPKHRNKTLLRHTTKDQQRKRRGLDIHSGECLQSDCVSYHYPFLEEI